MLFFLNKFIKRNEIHKFVFIKKTNFINYISYFLGLFRKFQKFKLKNQKFYNRCLIQYKSSSLRTQLMYLSYMEYESTYEQYLFKEEDQKQDKDGVLKRKKKFKSFFKNKFNILKSSIILKKLRKKINLKFSLVKKQNFFQFFFGLQQIFLFFYLNFFLLYFVENKQINLFSYFYNFINIKFYFIDIFYYTLNRQIIQKFLQLKNLKVASKLRKQSLKLFGFLQVNQKRYFILPQYKKYHKKFKYKKIFIIFYKFIFFNKIIYINTNPKNIKNVTTNLKINKTYNIIKK